MSIDFSVEKTGKSFTFTAVCKDLEQAIARVNGAMGASSSQTKFYFIAVRKGKLAVIAYSQDTFCAVQVPNAVGENEGIFGIDAASMAGIIKGRAQMEFEFNGRELAFKLIKGKYSGTLNTLSIPPEQLAHIAANFLTSKKDASNALSRDMLATLKEGMMVTNIKDVYAGKELASHIILDEKMVTISAFDTHHFALYRKKIKASGFNGLKVVLPVNHFNIIDKMVDASDKDSKFVLRAESVRVEGSNFLLVLPAIQTEPGNFQMVQAFLKGQGDLPYRYKYKAEQLTTLVNNLYTLNAVNANFEISNIKGGLQFLFNTQNGSARDAIKVETLQEGKKEAKVRADPLLLRDIITLSKAQDDTILSFKPGGTLRIECKTETGGTLTLTSALVQ